MQAAPGKDFHSLYQAAQRDHAQGRRSAARAGFLRAWQAGKGTAEAGWAVATGLIDLGDDPAALRVLQDTIQAHGESAPVCKILGEVALRMAMPDLGERAFLRACHLAPQDHDTLTGLASALMQQDKIDEAKALLLRALEVKPDHAPFWNALGNLINIHMQDGYTARPFLEKAQQLDPDNAQIRHNLALTYYRDSRAVDHFEAALALDPDNAHIRLAYALYLLDTGEVERALPYYEARLDAALGSRAAAVYTHNIRRWQGEDIAGKTLLVTAEQGLGDELFFACFVPALKARGARLVLGCDARLTALYERSFAGARAFGWSDVRDHRYRLRHFPDMEDARKAGLAVDYAIPAGSVPLCLGYRRSDFLATPGAVLLPDPAKLDAMRTRLAALPGKRLKIGLSWRSGNLSGERKHFYFGAQFVRELAARVDADFVVLQYSMTDAERALLAPAPNIYFLDGIDLKADLEANIAALSLLDASAGPPTATQMLALVAGCPVVLFNNAPPWTSFDGHLEAPLYAPGSRFFGKWSPTGQKTDADLVDALSAYIAALPLRGASGTKLAPPITEPALL